MDTQSFRQTLAMDQPPSSLNPYLKALWYAGKKNWEQAHQLVQDIENTAGAWIHAYLHRWEGDEWNAGYWYRRAGKPFPPYSLDEEWEIILEEMLKTAG